MARRAFVPPPTFGTEPLSRPGTGTSTRPSSLALSGLRSTAPPPTSVPPGRTSVPPAPGSGNLPESRRSLAPAPLPGSDGVSVAVVAQLLDRLAAADEAPFIATWIESVLAGRMRSDSTLAVRLLRAYRETGRVDRARDLAASLPIAPTSWSPLDGARLAIERTIDGRSDHADAELRLASRALAAAPKGTGLREQLDLHLAQAQLELKLNRTANASSALRLAEHVAERLEDGPWRAPVGMTLGHLSMRLADPRTAVKHYVSALGRASSRGAAAMSAHGNLAIALGSIGRFDEGRFHATTAVAVAREIAAGWRHADAYDVLAIVEIAADRPASALRAIDEALGVLGEIDHPVLRYQLAEHRAWALAMLERAQPSRQWLGKAEKLRADLSVVDAMDEQDLVATRARTLEVCGQTRAAMEQGLAHIGRLEDAFVTGSLNLVIGRCALALGDEAGARAAVERAALSGEKHGWIFPDRTPSLALWQLALKSGDSRVVRYAERTIELVESPNASIPPAGVLLPLDSSSASIPPSSEELAPLSEPPEGETLLYVTTPQGVTRIPAGELGKATEEATLVVDTLAHHLRVNDREVSLERRRALEPLVVQLLRRAKEGLSADEILRAAGGPGPESADAEHRVRVLISRVRDLLGDPTAIERVRDAGEYGRTRYRLAANVRFALVEPLFSSS
jgi:tetratricopeptide (TPR) repeat protein